jgi:hypothetical protein
MSTAATIVNLSTASDSAALAAGMVAGKRYRANYIMGGVGTMTVQMVEIPVSGCISYDANGNPVVIGTPLTDATAFASAAQVDPYVTNYRDKLTTTNATPVVARSLTIAPSSVLFVDVIATFQNTALPLTGGYTWNTLAFARGASGVPVALGTIDIVESHLTLVIGGVTFVPNVTTNNIDITVTGKLATSIGWSLRTTADRGNP